MKNARERMDVIAAYRDVGSYRGAAAICGTTHKTVKRVIAQHETGGTLGAAKNQRWLLRRVGWVESVVPFAVEVVAGDG